MQSIFRIKVLLFIAAIVLSPSIGITAQTSNADASSISAVDAVLRKDTIDNVIKLLTAKYAYPEIALKMETEIRRREKQGEYSSITDGSELARKLTVDLRSVFDDKHLQLSYSAKAIPVRSARSGTPSAEEMEAMRTKQKRANFGAVKLEILAGNVGLLQLNYFAPLEWSAETYTSAMNYVANTDALIIDIRQNRGSMDIDTIPFFCSYLFAEPVQIGDMFTRETNETRQLWTYAQVPGKKYLDKPIFILTSPKTASGAEAFVERLGHLKRATSIGEPTAGATMPGSSNRVNEHFSIWISIGRASTSNAKSENAGFKPDIAVNAADALKTAHAEALKQIMQTGSDAEWKKEIGVIYRALVGN